MNHKLWFLTKMSLNKKIKTKWFLIANMIFLILIVGIINIDGIIKMFGGDFDETQEILVIDNIGVYDEFKNTYDNSVKYISDYEDTEIIKYNKSYDEGIAEIDESNNKILLIIEEDIGNYIKAKVVSNDGVGSITITLIRATLGAIKNDLVLTKYNISKDMLNEINSGIDIENVVLSEDNIENNMIVSTIMQVIIFPVFMLIIFLVQMIGAEVNEEKTTRSMEIIISNVSPKTHFLSKIIASNVFVIFQALLLITFLIIGVFIRFVTSGGSLMGELDGEVESFISTINLDGILGTIQFMIPILIIIIILTFISYSLLAGVLASMTTNLEDYQQLQTPIVIISLIGYYLSVMAGVFKGSLFIRIMSYIPFISSMLAPTLYVLGEIGIVDIIISVLLLVGTILLLVKYGIRIYKVGILNYSGTGLWKKMFKAMRK